jgi:hypothetical protein
MNSVKFFSFETRWCGGRFVLPAVLFFLMTGSGCSGGKGEVDQDRFSVLGTVMAGKTAQLCDGKGSVVLVVSENDKNKSTPYAIALDAFRKGLGNSVQVTATEFVQTPRVIMRGVESLPAEKFAELLQKYSSADCLVSFVGVPSLAAAQIAQLPSPRPRVVVVVTHGLPSKALFAKKVVCLAAFPKQVSDQPVTSGTSQEIFDAQYQIITPENAGTLPY